MTGWKKGAAIAVAVAALGAGGALVARDAAGAGGEQCRDPRIYGHGFDPIQSCRPKRWYRKAQEMMAAMARGEQLDDDPRRFLCFDDEPETREALDKAAGYCREMEDRMARLAADPASAVDSTMAMIGGFAWTVLSDPEAMGELWGKHGLIRATLDDNAWQSFHAARHDPEGPLKKSWQGLSEAGVDQIPVLGRSTVVLEPAKNPGESWRWRWEAPMRFTRVHPGKAQEGIAQGGQPALPGKGFQPPQRTVEEMKTVVVLKMRGRFDPGWAGDHNPLGVVAETYDEVIEAPAGTPTNRGAAPAASPPDVTKPGFAPAPR